VRPTAAGEVRVSAWVLTDLTHHSIWWNIYEIILISTLISYVDRHFLRAITQCCSLVAVVGVALN